MDSLGTSQLKNLTCQVILAKSRSGMWKSGVSAGRTDGWMGGWWLPPAIPNQRGNVKMNRWTKNVRRSTSSEKNTIYIYIILTGTWRPGGVELYICIYISYRPIIYAYSCCALIKVLFFYQKTLGFSMLKFRALRWYLFKSQDGTLWWWIEVSNQILSFQLPSS